MPLPAATAPRPTPAINRPLSAAPALLPPDFHSDDARWQAVRTRDVRADGQFVYAVLTTKVYGQPSAASRLPLRANVVFFDSARAAEAAGYRPSRRSLAEQHTATSARQAMVADACRQIALADTTPSLAELAATAGMPLCHFQRIFKTITGLTPRAYAAAERVRRHQAKVAHTERAPRWMTPAPADAPETQLPAGPAAALTAAASGTGNATTAVTTPPTSAQALLPLRAVLAPCALGTLLVAQRGPALCAVLLGDDPASVIAALQAQFPGLPCQMGAADVLPVAARLAQLIETPHQRVELPLDLQGTAFQRRVWEALREVPVGQTITYVALARRLGAPHATRAVALACAANPLAVLIPCHRVVRQDGSVSGHRWGVARQRELLRRESRPSATPSVPGQGPAHV